MSGEEGLVKLELQVSIVPLVTFLRYELEVHPFFTKMGGCNSHCPLVALFLMSIPRLSS